MSKCKDCSVAWKTKLYIRRYRQKVCMNLTAEKRATHTRSVDTIKWFWLMPSEYINSMCKEHDGMDVWYSFLSSLKPTKSTISYSHTNKAVERVQRFHFHTNQFSNFCVWVAWKFSIDLLNARLSSFSPMFARRKVPKLMQNDCSPRHYKRILWKMCSYCSRINWESFLLVSGAHSRESFELFRNLLEWYIVGFGNNMASSSKAFIWSKILFYNHSYCLIFAESWVVIKYGANKMSLTRMWMMCRISANVSTSKECTTFSQKRGIEGVKCHERFLNGAKYNRQIGMRHV